MDFQPVIIIGAPRSGTNMLRDMLIQLPDFGTWPCDEINYIWRHGNLRHPSDVFTPEMALPGVQSYIREQFNELASARNLGTVVEKTCANSLRVGFVDKIIPEAKYIFIVRDGMDAVGSALQRWTASLDIPYILQKARYVPRSDLSYYALRYLFHRMYRIFSRESRIALWGPAMDNIEELLKQYTLTEVCALQWKACVDKAEDDFLRISTDRVIKVKYEDFVQEPVLEFERLASFLGKNVPDDVENHLRMNVSSNSVGKGRNQLGEEGVNNLRPLILNTMERYGYE